MSSSPFSPPPPDLLSAFNERWQARNVVAHRCQPPPWWAPGTVASGELHYQYQRYLPVVDYLRELEGLLASSLPHPLWVPSAVRRPEQWASLAALWDDLPEAFGGRLTWSVDDLWPLACALADLEPYGSRAGRYPEQRELLGKLQLAPGDLILDHGCGTGQGSWEIAGWLSEAGRPLTLLGITREPLEAWMAREQRLPHHPKLPPDRIFPPPPTGLRCSFVAGDIRTFALTAPARLVVCNGLIGGPALHAEAELEGLLQRLTDSLGDGGWLLVGDRFHGGWDASRARFRELALQRFAIVGEAGRSLLLRLDRPNSR